MDGEYCMTGGADKSLKLWNPKKGTLLKSYSGHGADVTDVRASQDNSFLASGSSDKSVLLWDVGSGQLMRRYHFHAGPVTALCLAGADHGSVLFSASQDCRVAVWDRLNRTSAPLMVMDEARDSVMDVFVDKFNVFTCSLDKNIRCYDIRKGQLRTDFVGHPLTNVCVSKDGQCVLISCQDHRLRLFDVVTGELLNEYEGHVNSDYRVDSVILPSDDLIVSGSEDGHIYVWDLLTAKVNPLSPLHPPSKKVVNTPLVQSLSAHPKAMEENTLLSSQGDWITLWSAEKPD